MNKVSSDNLILVFEGHDHRQSESFTQFQWPSSPPPSMNFSDELPSMGHLVAAKRMTSTSSTPPPARYTDPAGVFSYQLLGQQFHGAFGIVRPAIQVPADHHVPSTIGSSTVVPPFPEDSHSFYAVKEVRNAQNRHACDVIANEIKTYRYLQQLGDASEGTTHHPNVVGFVDQLGISGKRMVIEYLDGGELGQVTPRLRQYLQTIANHPDQDPAIASLLSCHDIPTFILAAQRQLCMDVCHGLKFLHDRRVIHNDLKGDNVFIDSKTGSAKLGDLSEARLFGDLLTIPQVHQAPPHISETMHALGALAIQSPEMHEYKGATQDPEVTASEDTGADYNPEIIRIGTPSDIWSLGMLLHAVICETNFVQNPDIFQVQMYLWRRGKQQEGVITTRLKQTIDTTKLAGEQLYDLLCEIFKPNPADRIQLANIMQHPFFTCPSVVIPEDAIRHLISHAVAGKQEMANSHERNDELDFWSALELQQPPPFFVSWNQEGKPTKS